MKTWNTSVIGVPVHIRETLKSVSAELTSRGEEPEIPITSLPTLNNKIWGLKRKELFTIAARPSNGKSSFCMFLAHTIASQGFKTIYLSLEMTISEMVERLFCIDQSVDNQDLLHGKFPQYKEKWDKFNDKMTKSPLILSDGIGKSWAEVDSLIENEIEGKVDVVIVDYVQCIAVKSKSEREEISEYVRHFRELAIRNNFCGILISQINRGIKDNNNLPSVEMIKSSGAIEELSDKIALLHFPYYYNDTKDPREYIFYLAKNRNGRTGKVTMKFIPEYYQFEDFLKEVAPEPEEQKVMDTFKSKRIYKGHGYVEEE